MIPFNVLDVQENFKHEKLHYSESNTPMQFDTYIPQLSLAVEYQHYSDASSKRYVEKRNACKEAGITLVEVPYWWDFSSESLAATINRAKPELIASEAEPIPTTPPKEKATEEGSREEEAEVVLEEILPEGLYCKQYVCCCNHLKGRVMEGMSL